MTYQVSVYSPDGLRTSTLPITHTIAAARQSMLDHSNTIDLPVETPFHCPDLGILEGWFIGRTEYQITQGV